MDHCKQFQMKNTCGLNWHWQWHPAEEPFLVRFFTQRENYLQNVTYDQLRFLEPSEEEDLQRRKRDSIIFAKFIVILVHSTSFP